MSEVDKNAADIEESESENTDSDVEDETEEDSGWLSNMMEFLVEGTETTINLTASTIRDSVHDTVDLVSTSIVDTDFYKTHMSYSPAPVQPPVQPPSSKSPSKKPASSPKSKQRASSMASLSSMDESVDEEEEHGQEEEAYNEFVHEMLSEIESLPIQDRLTACGRGNSIGVLKLTLLKTKNLFVDGVVSAGTTHPYFVVRLGPLQTWTSPIATREVKPGQFAVQKTLQLVAHDINTDLIVQVFQKNVLLEDHCMGQVIVPLSQLVPSLLTELHNRRHPPTATTAAVAAPCWYELFPSLRAGQRKYKPASADIAQTGLWKAKLGFLQLQVDLQLHSEISMWAGYAKAPVEKLIDAPQPPVPSGDVMAVRAVNETGRGFKRNFQRVKTAFARLFSREPYSWPLFRFMARVQAFSNWKLSLLVWLAVTYACLWAPGFLLPLNLFAVLLVGTLCGGGGGDGEAEEPTSFLVWEQDVHDPDDDLGPIQKLAKVVFLLAKFERWMGIAADAMERTVHVFSFADERVTVAALLVCGLAAVVASAVLYCLHFGSVCYAGFLWWLLVSSRNHSGGGSKASKRKKRAAAVAAKRQKKYEEERRQRRRRHRLEQRQEQRRQQQQQGAEGEEEVRAACDDEEDDEKPRSRAGKLRHRIGMMLSAPRLARNVFSRVPTQDELGHRWIANLQRVGADEPEDDAVPEVPGEAETWFREM